MIKKEIGKKGKGWDRKKIKEGINNIKKGKGKKMKGEIKLRRNRKRDKEGNYNNKMVTFFSFMFSSTFTNYCVRCLDIYHLYHLYRYMKKKIIHYN